MSYTLEPGRHAEVAVPEVAAQASAEVSYEIVLDPEPGPAASAELVEPPPPQGARLRVRAPGRRRAGVEVKALAREPANASVWLAALLLKWRIAVVSGRS